MALDKATAKTVKTALQAIIDQANALNTLLALPDWGELEDAPPPTPTNALSFEDATNTDVGPLLTKYAGLEEIPLVGLVALIHAESGFDPTAVRRGAWPDVSAGYSQMTVQTAAGYGLGDGTDDPTNVEAVLGALQGRETGIRLAARHFAMCLSVARQRFPSASGDELLLLGMRAYNGGTDYGLTDDYAVKYAANLASYGRALELAHMVLKGKGWD